jgi:formylglycine-generating enzyme required for sulfatase activity/predicted Ser/Thr protein kinase
MTSPGSGIRGPASVDSPFGRYYDGGHVSKGKGRQAVSKQVPKCWKCGHRLEADPAGGDPSVCKHCQAGLAGPTGERHFDEVDPLIGQTLGEFEILELVGRGGMGTVYKACQGSLDRFVAVKVLSDSLSVDDSYVARFSREARAAAAVSHPNIIEVYSVGQDAGHRYIAMELVEGENLADLLEREGRLAPARALEVLRQTAAALVEAHERGILHRDIKPANILLDRKGRVKVADFGLAKRSDADVGLTLGGQALGTPLYLPPDVARGRPFDARSDLYSVGATLYHAVAGQPPFDGQTPTEVILKHIEAPIPPLQALAPDAPAALCRIIHRLLCKDPDDRYPSAEALLAALGDVDGQAVRPPSAVRGVSATATMAVPAGSPVDSEPAPRPRRRRLAFAAAMGVVACTAVLLAFMLSRGGERPPMPAYTTWPFDGPEAGRRQQATAKALGLRVEENVDLGNGVKMTFVLIPAGEFLMGSPPTTSPEQLERVFGKEQGSDFSREFPQHRVRISRPFWLAKTEVTQAQWEAVMGDNPSKFKGRPNNPVERVSWNDCQVFVWKLSEKLKKTCRLPTEAEWEYACRAGTPTEFYFGDSDTELGDHAWFSGNSRGSTQAVGKAKPNAWGLYDMAGSVWECCGDQYAPYDKAFQEDPNGPGADGARVLRGGSWLHRPMYCRSACRGMTSPEVRNDNLSFRVAKAIDVPIEPPAGAPVGPPSPEARASKVRTQWSLDVAEAGRRQQATAEALGVHVEETLDLGNGVKMTFVLIPAGEFLMGNPPTPRPEQLEKVFGKDQYLDYAMDFPQHAVKISRPFWLGKTPVTQQQWRAVSDDDPSEFPGRDQNPVEKVSWEDCRQFLLKLGATTEKKLRLPTEAEWEYACRAGAATAFYFGDDPADLDAHAWHSGNAGGRTHPVGKTKPNAWGLYDMAGNVWQWCEDWHGPYRTGTETDPNGAGPTGYRTLRGGSWRDGPPGYFLSAHRCANIPSYRAMNVGFRVARTIAAASNPGAGAKAVAPASPKAQPPPAKASP